MTDSPTPEEIRAAIEEAQQEILDDIVEGRVPGTVRDFSSLHDYVDANEYAGLCDPARRASWGTPSVSEVQDGVHAWLQAGRPPEITLLTWRTENFLFQATGATTAQAWANLKTFWADWCTQQIADPRLLIKCRDDVHAQRLSPMTPALVDGAPWPSKE